MTKIIAVANQKGGVGKTTTAVNLATSLAAIKNRVLLIDLDPQGNATTGVGVENIKGDGIYDVLINGVPMREHIYDSMVPYLSVVPSSVNLSGAELELIEFDQRESQLKFALAPLEGQYDYIMIDCPPALGLLTLNALVGATEVLVPLQCEFYALEGLSYLIRTVERVKKVFNPELKINGVVLTMFDARNNLSRQVAADVQEYFKNGLYNTIIPRNVKVSEAPSHGKPVLLYDMRCTGSKAYMALAKELLRREKQEILQPI